MKNYESRKPMGKFLTLLLLTAYCLALTAHQTYADTSQGNDYILHMKVEDTDSNDQNLPYNKPGSYIIKQVKETPTPTTKPILQPSASPTPPPTSIQVGYTDHPTSDQLQLMLSDDIVDFGPLSPTDFITRATRLTIQGNSLYEYSVLAFENHTLVNAKNQPIPSTRCDDGNCTDTQAGDWTDTLTFGYGYRCQNIQGSDCEKNFTGKDMYKHFVSTEQNATGIPVMQGNATSEKKADIIYKINVPGTQQQGTYQNAITYVAVPMY